MISQDPHVSDYSQIFQKNPLLCEFGFAPQGAPVKAGQWRRMSQKDRLTIIESSQADLLQKTEAIAAIETFFQNVELTEHSGINSYYLKDLAEELLHFVEDKYVYVPNGALILVALALKLPVERYPQSPNAAIGITRSWISQKCREIRLYGGDRLC